GVGGEAEVLDHKVVLVTGASSGIGRAIALRCARAGADLAITYRKNQSGAEATAREIRSLGRRAEVIRTDIGQPEEIRDLADRLKQLFGTVHVWINNAGADILTGQAGRLDRLEKLDLVLSVDLRGTVLASWAAVDLMRAQGGGAIINMAWDHISLGMKGENPSLYSAAKGGVSSFSKSLARDVAPEIRVNILAPGFIETAFGQEADPKFRQHVIETTPLRRWGTPEDVAAAAVFLASDDAAFLTGQMIAVNGGVVM
ncbi:MAG TPA: SDR family oxidoreductase, partial [Gemmatimonadales bacterium]|nr:SDR family oxidoreductase [Gemmatimonadales bacterium]